MANMCFIYLFIHTLLPPSRLGRYQDKVTKLEPTFSTCKFTGGSGASGAQTKEVLLKKRRVTLNLRIL